MSKLIPIFTNLSSFSEQLTPFSQALRGYPHATIPPPQKDHPWNSILLWPLDIKNCCWLENFSPFGIQFFLTKAINAVSFDYNKLLKSMDTNNLLFDKWLNLRVYNWLQNDKLGGKPQDFTIYTTIINKKCCHRPHKCIGSSLGSPKTPCSIQLTKFIFALR